MKKIMMIAPKTKTFINFRGDLMKDIKKKEYNIVAVIPEDEEKEFLKENNIKTVLINVNKNSLSILNTINYYKQLRKIINKEKPDKVFSYTIKPVIFGSIAAKKENVKEIYSLICGLGYLYSVRNIKTKLLRIICGLLYKYAFKVNKKVIFQNENDLNEFVKRKYVEKEKCEIVNGSGVNLDKFKRNDLPNDKISFLMISRILKQKGVIEYCKAAKIIKEKYQDVSFTYIGDLENKRGKGTYKKFKKYIEGNTIKYIKETKHVEDYLKEASVFVLPTYYGEGIPRTIIEAAAMARPIITTNIPGCREVVIDGKNGVFVKEKDVNDLVEKMEYMIKNKDKLQSMGNEGFKICKEKFTIDIINNKMMEIMDI